MFLAPFWWAFTTWSEYWAAWKFMTEPHHWDKTEHVHDLEEERIALELVNA
jgi:hypothetical protein